MFYNFRKNKKAFTLVELIVVIAIIAILGAVAGTTVAVFLDRAKKTAASTPLTDFSGKWDAKDSKQTLKAYIAELFPQDVASIKISDDSKLTKTSFGSGDTFTLYFHDDNCGDYYGVLVITKGVPAKNAEAKKDDTTKNAWNSAKAVS